jgi:hypothetical protein
MTTLLPLAMGVTEITWFLTVPCSPLSLSTYTHLFPTANGKNATAPLPVDTDLADPELADPELADPELADPELDALAAGWLDEDDALEPEGLPQPARTSPEAAATASMLAAFVREVKPDLFISCLGLEIRSVGDSRLSAAGH